MADLIDKAAVVAEIEGIENETNYEPFTDEVLGKRKVCKDIKDYIETLEVKEVDLEKEIRTEIDEYWYDNDYGAIQRHGGTITMEVSDVKEIAKHFFELGLSVSNKAQKGGKK